MQLSPIEVKQFQKKILSWYKNNKRSLPWRGIPDDIPLADRAYRILVSEVMLQQTQVSRVIPKYEAWFEKFPTVEALADALMSDVLRLWSGLGYNRRALNLQRTALIISKEYRGVWPKQKDQLKKLPGIGEYTAGAVACFAFNEQVAVVDTNVRKVILLELLQEQKVVNPREMQELAEELLPKGRARDWNQALMDYAALVLKDRKVLLKKQSAFKGSRRYFRGKLLKVLLRDGAIAIVSIRKMLAEDAFPVSDAWLAEIVREMEDDGFVRCDKTKIYLRS